MARSGRGLGTLWGVEEWGELNGEHEARKLRGKEAFGTERVSKEWKDGRKQPDEVEGQRLDRNKYPVMFQYHSN